MNNIISLIPARAGSKRVKNKNIREFCGHPLIAYTIESALQSGIFDKVIVSTESTEIAEISHHYGAEVPFMRPSEMAADLSPDFEWISYTMERLAQEDREYEYFSILRPTSPFRLPTTIQRAWDIFRRGNADNQYADSLRAVEKCGQHPYKMWVLDEKEQRMQPFVQEKVNGKCGFSLPYQALPKVYVQNASLEISRTDVLSRFGEITGEKIIPFITDSFEGFDINTQQDWEYGQQLATEQSAKLPEIRKSAWVNK